MVEALVQIQPKKYTSRSAVLTYKTCHYKRYLAYELDSFGYVPSALNLDLTNGNVIHKGLRHLFEHCRLHAPDEQLTEGCIDEAVEVAKAYWEQCLAKANGVQLKSSEEYDRLDWILEEQSNLQEGLIRAFALYRLPTILDEYEILEVEHEEVFEGFSPLVTFLGAADGLFRRKRDNKLIVLSIKTASEFADVTTRDILHDMQGCSESFLVQERLQRLWHKIMAGDYNSEDAKKDNCLSTYNFLVDYCEHNSPKVFAVQYEYLIKGKRRQDPYGSGIYKQQSFLVHPLIKDQIIKIGFGANAGIMATNPSEYKWKWGSGAFPKGWQKGDIWNDIGVKNWVEILNSGMVQPENGHPFENIIVSPDLIVRSEREIEEWLVSTRFQEEQIARFLSMLAEVELDINEHREIYSQEDLDEIVKRKQEMIWAFFDKNTQSCHDYYGKDCVYVKHCHELEDINDMILADNLTPRISHHEAEKEEQIRIGFIEND